MSLKLKNKISGSLRNVQPMPLTICRRLTQASEPITTIHLFQHVVPTLINIQLKQSMNQIAQAPTTR